ncbi:hypothetical protein BG55_15130 [Erwinia mallotivora]|uniref:Uncharacterized protein n=1 Tax=Erwinia mallotivora TaxID=69222 RepID=A0A014N6M6_9GAMM|nr:hypothetical protein BG55_15130 [Erwinia mallotivora]
MMLSDKNNGEMGGDYTVRIMRLSPPGRQTGGQQRKVVDVDGKRVIAGQAVSPCHRWRKGMNGTVKYFPFISAGYRMGINAGAMKINAAIPAGR